MKDPKDMTEEELEKWSERLSVRISAAIDAEDAAAREYREAHAALDQIEREQRARRSTPPGGAK